MNRFPTDFTHLGALLENAAARRARRRRRAGVTLAVMLVFTVISGASLAASQSVRAFFGIDEDEYTILDEGRVAGVPYAKVQEKESGQEGAFVAEPDIRSGGNRYEEYLRWQRLMDDVLRAASQEIFGEVCTVEQLTQAEVATIETFVEHGFRPGDSKATVETHLAVDETIAPGGEAPCRGIGFAHSQVDLIFRGIAPPADLLPGAQEAYEAVDE